MQRVRLDLCGEVCPYTFVRAKLALEDEALGEGDELLLVLDHQPARTSLPRALREEGHEVLALLEEVAAEPRPVPAEPSAELTAKNAAAPPPPFAILVRKRTGVSSGESG